MFKVLSLKLIFFILIGYPLYGYGQSVDDTTHHLRTTRTDINTSITLRDVPARFRKKLSLTDKSPKDTRKILRYVFFSFNPHRTREQIDLESRARAKENEKRKPPQIRGPLNVSDERTWYDEGVLFSKNNQTYTSQCNAYVDPSSYADYKLWFRERKFESELVNMRLQAQLDYDPVNDVYTGHSETTDHYFVVYTDGYGDLEHIFYYADQETYLENKDNFLVRCDGLLLGVLIRPVGFTEFSKFWKNFIISEKN